MNTQPTARWIELPAAKAALASIAQNPPATHVVPVGDGSYRTLYRGREAQALRRIHHTECARLLKLGDETGDYAPFKACSEMTVERAIGEVVAELKMGEAA